MHKLIHTDFEIDLSTIDLTIVEENHWFSDTFFTKYSYPFSLELTDEVKKAFEDVLDYRSKDNTLQFEVIYVFNDIRENAILIIESLVDVINLKFSYGIEEFPNFNKKLSELGLQKLEVEDIYEHAKDVISQSWPDVNYNFPQIHTDKKDTSEEMWQYFLKIINNYKDGDFIINEVIDDIPNNRNLMQPLPYFMHILKQGFADAGYTLMGDILSIETLQKKLLYAETDYHKTLDQFVESTIVLGSDKVYSDGNLAEFYKVITLPQSGKYRITGTINIYSRWKRWVDAEIFYRGNRIWFNFMRIKNHHSGYLSYFDVDITIDTKNDLGPHEIIFQSSQYNKDDNVICDLNTSSLFFYDEFGVAIPNVINNNTIDLNRLVPEITFGSFVTVIKNWYNLDIEPRGKDIYMNFIEDKINYNNAFDLSNFQTIPERNFNKEVSFLLQFAEPSDEKNKHKEVFFDASGYGNTNYKKTDKTLEIKIDAFPLLNFLRSEVQTAYAVESESNKIYAVLYDGLNEDGLNLTIDPAPILLSAITENYYRKWFEFRLDSINFKWVFSTFTEMLNGLKAKTKIFAFDRYHIIKTLTKRQVAKDEFEVEIDSFTLK